MSSLKDRTHERAPARTSDSLAPALAVEDGQRRELDRHDGRLCSAAVEAQQRWIRLAHQGKWMITVYRSSEATKVDVVRLRRAHLNDRAKVRVQAEVGQIVHGHEADLALLEQQWVLDVPVERILWYEIINEIPAADVRMFQAALAKGLQASREIEEGEPLTSAEAAWRRPR
ncbi:MAG: hypothetical protein IT424_03400 [Pirellulales bacterium]|nr:hypothetical protein [Pirellulales bacterium]